MTKTVSHAEDDDLSRFARDVHSQFGEDGLVEEILRRIALTVPLDRWCVEFGAWDGVHLSNTCRLIREEAYSAVLIEGDRGRFRALERHHPDARVHKRHRWVSLEGEDTLDRILATTPIPSEFDFLSIDVDGADYHVFDGLRRHRPKVICIEFNPTIPNQVDWAQPPDLAIRHGASARAIQRLAGEKGYVAVAATAVNLLLVRDDLAPLVQARSRSLPALRPEGEEPMIVFVGYDGTVLSNRETLRNHWHRFDVGIADLQVLPRVLRKAPFDWGPFRRLLFAAWFGRREPAELRRRLRRRFGGRD